MSHSVPQTSRLNPIQVGMPLSQHLNQLIGDIKCANQNRMSKPSIDECGARRGASRLQHNVSINSVRSLGNQIDTTSANASRQPLLQHQARQSALTERSSDGLRLNVLEAEVSGQEGSISMLHAQHDNLRQLIEEQRREIDWLHRVVQDQHVQPGQQHDCQSPGLQFDLSDKLGSPRSQAFGVHVQELLAALESLQEKPSADTNFCDAAQAAQATAQEALAELREERLEVTRTLESVREEKLEIVAAMHAFQIDKAEAVHELLKARCSGLPSSLTDGRLNQRLAHDADQPAEDEALPQWPPAVSPPASPCWLSDPASVEHALQLLRAPASDKAALDGLALLRQKTPRVSNATVNGDNISTDGSTGSRYFRTESDDAAHSGKMSTTAPSTHSPGSIPSPETALTDSLGDSGPLVLSQGRAQKPVSFGPSLDDSVPLSRGRDTESPALDSLAFPSLLFDESPVKEQHHQSGQEWQHQKNYEVRQEQSPDFSALETSAQTAHTARAVFLAAFECRSPNESQHSFRLVDDCQLESVRHDATRGDRTPISLLSIPPLVLHGLAAPCSSVPSSRGL